MEPITELLRRSREGDRDAAEQLSSLVYAQLHRIAEGCLRSERPEHTLTATALVNEAWIRLSSGGPAGFQDRGHFFALAAKKMRQILVDYARRRTAAKRGSGKQEPLSDSLAVAAAGDTETLLAIHQILDRLEAANPRRARWFEMRYFGGMTPEEIAEVDEMSLPTVYRELRLAQAWLFQQMQVGDS